MCQSFASLAPSRACENAELIGVGVIVEKFEFRVAI